jgi:hypothetical protein
MKKVVFFVIYNQNVQVKEDEMGRLSSTYVEDRNAYRISVGKPEGKPKRRQKGNIKMDLRETDID